MVLRQGYAVWTYLHPTKSPRQIRRLTEWLFQEGYRPLILQCDRDTCRIYGDDLTEEGIKRRLDAIRPTEDSYIRITPAPHS